MLRDDGSGTAALLRDLVYDENGSLRPGRLSALLQVSWGQEGLCEVFSLCVALAEVDDSAGCRVQMLHSVFD